MSPEGVVGCERFKEEWKVNNPKAAYGGTKDYATFIIRALGLCPACADPPAALSAARAGAAAGRRNVAVYRSYRETLQALLELKERGSR